MLTVAPTLPATGRELDAQVAERVFGARVHRPSDGFLTMHYSWKDSPYLGTSIHWARDDEDYHELLGERKAGSELVRLVPRYSTNLTTAWTVVDWMNDRGRGDFFRQLPTPFLFSSTELAERICQIAVAVLAPC